MYVLKHQIDFNLREIINKSTLIFKTLETVIELKTKKRGKNMPTYWIIFWITSKSPVFAEDELSFSVFPVAEDEQSLFFFASFWNFFFRMLVDLEHDILICVAMELQRRGGSQSLEDSILICVAMELQRSAGCQSEIWRLHFGVCFFCLGWAAWCFYRWTFNESEPLQTHRMVF